MMDSSQSLEEELMEQKHRVMENQQLNEQKIEGLEQERYSLIRRLDTLTRSYQDLQLEYERIQETSTKETENEIWKITAEKDAAIKELKYELSAVEQNFEELNLIASQKQEKIALLEKQLEEAMEHVNTTVLNETTSEETERLNQVIAGLLNEKQSLEIQVNRGSEDLQICKLKLEASMKEITSLQESLEEKECENTSCYNTIESLRTEIQELNMEIEVIRMNEVDPSKKGNSLFSEIEDERQRVQKCLTSMKERYRTLNEQNVALQHQQLRLKQQLAAVMSMNSCRVDQTQMAELNEAVQTAKEEVKFLREKITRLEADKDKTETDQSQSFIVPNGYNNEVSAVPALQAMIRQSEKENAELKREVERQRFLQFAENDNVIRLRQQAMTDSITRDRLKAENVRLTLALQEMKIKSGEYEEPVVTIVREKLPDDSIQNKEQKQSPSELTLKDKSPNPSILPGTFEKPNFANLPRPTLASYRPFSVTTKTGDKKTEKKVTISNEATIIEADTESGETKSWKCQRENQTPKKYYKPTRRGKTAPVVYDSTTENMDDQCTHQ